MAKYEKPQKGNPHRLTVNQHIFPTRSIERFADDAGTVSLNDMRRGFLRRAKPTDDIFCAQRAWDQRAESGYMKEIEDQFQRVAVDVLGGAIANITEDNKLVVSRFYALWYFRARQRLLPMQAVEMKGVTSSRSYTKDERELLEKNGVVAIQDGNMLPLRHINGMQLQLKMARYADQVSEHGEWQVIQAHEGEFLVPDVPSHNIIPLTPTICLAIASKSGMITRSNVADINQAFATTASEYIFARELGKCPLF